MTTLMEVTVAIADAYLPNFAEVVAACEAQGLQVSQRLPAIGAVVGRISPDRISELADVAGVAAVEQAQGYQLPPPESDLQ
jgi:hypothetical protein